MIAAADVSFMDSSQLERLWRLVTVSRLPLHAEASNGNLTPLRGQIARQLSPDRKT